MQIRTINKGMIFKLIRLLCIFLMICIITPCFARDASYLPLRDKFTDFSKVVGKDAIVGVTEPYYYEVLKEYEEKGYKDVHNVEIVLNTEDINDSSEKYLPMSGNVGGRNDVLYWDEKYQWFEWEVNIPESGLYEIYVEYYPLPGLGSAAIRSIEIDGRIPYTELNNIAFTRMWRDKGEPKINNVGDEVRPSQEEIVSWRTVALTDSKGFYSQPFKFYFEKGTHRIRMNYIDQPMAIGNIIIKSPENIPSYTEVLNSYKSISVQQQSNWVGKFQAENTVVEKSDPTIRRESDGEPACEPQSIGNIRLNVIGGYRWRKGNQSITWKFNVPEDGFYKIGMRLAQSAGDGLPVYRQIEIDGKIPFKELSEYKFTYDRKWKTEVLKDHVTGEPFLFYLTKGEHTITMTVKMGELADVVQSVYEDTLAFSEMIRKIIMITGSEPDPNYEYELDENIPGLMDEMQRLSDSMKMKVDILTKISTKRPASANNFLLIKSQLDNMLKKPDNISRGLNDLKSAQESLGNWYLSMQEQPLTIDYFLIGSPDAEFEYKSSNIFQRIYASWVNFIISFKKDYDSVGNVYDTKEKPGASVDNNSSKENVTLNVWISRGREWAEIIKELADEDFTPKTGIQINMNVLPASQLEAGAVNALMLAIASGRAPDVACGVGVTSPVEYAIRGATLDLSKFEDFEEISQRFLPQLFIPFEYNGGIYGLPETMDFRVLFYRKDIIDELRIKIPETWEDVYNYVLPILYQNNMQFFIPIDFTMFLFQHGGSFYNEDGTESALDSPEAYRAFKEFTEIYTSYGVPISANFYMRFRTGEMPMGIGGYGEYLTLSVAAPELIGRWAIAPIPGHRKEDGTIDRSTGGIAQQADIILQQTKHPYEAWSFLKWWSSAEVQAQYGKELEALIGVEARWNTANIDAFVGLSWKKEDLDVIKSTWKWAREAPVVLGGYFTGRHVFNAWNRVVLGNMRVRDSLEQAVEDINKELRMKQEEYGYKVSQ